MIPLFIKVSLLEGLSLLLLLFVAMPLKYFWAMPEVVSVVGMAHGLLFIGYLVFSLAAAHKGEWSLAFYLWALFCALIPFGFIVLNKSINKKVALAKSNA